MVYRILRKFSLFQKYNAFELVAFLKRSKKNLIWVGSPHSVVIKKYALATIFPVSFIEPANHAEIWLTSRVRNVSKITA